MWVQSLGQEDPLEEEMATHSSILAGKIPWTEEPGGLQSTGSQRVGHNRVTEHTCMHACTGVSKWLSSISTISSPFCTQTLYYSESCNSLNKDELLCCHSFFLINYLILIGGWLLYNIVVVFAIHSWISHEYICVPHPEPPFPLPPHPIPQGHPRAPALSTLSHASNLDWRSISHMIIYMFQCYSLKSSLAFSFFFFTKYTLG